MPVATIEYVEAIAHLPTGAVLRVADVSWMEYEQLLADLGEGYAVRIFYDQGRMEIIALASTHERPKIVMHNLVEALGDELGIELTSFGSTTFKHEMRAKGAEPDDCFYVQNADRILGKETLNLESDPPPDLVIEIDHTNASLSKFPIYAGLGVPEIWRVVQRNLRIYQLIEDRYEESLTSRAFPFLPAQTLSTFLAQGLAGGERTAVHAFRAWVREHH